MSKINHEIEFKKLQPAFGKILARTYIAYNVALIVLYLLSFTEVIKNSVILQFEVSMLREFAFVRDIAAITDDSRFIFVSSFMLMLAIIANVVVMIGQISRRDVHIKVLRYEPIEYRLAGIFGIPMFCTLSVAVLFFIDDGDGGIKRKIAGSLLSYVALQGQIAFGIVFVFVMQIIIVLGYSHIVYKYLSKKLRR